MVAKTSRQDGRTRAGIRRKMADNMQWLTPRYGSPPPVREFEGNMGMYKRQSVALEVHQEPEKIKEVTKPRFEVDHWAQFLGQWVRILERKMVNYVWVYRLDAVPNAFVLENRLRRIEAPLPHDDLVVVDEDWIPPDWYPEDAPEIGELRVVA